MYWWQYPITGPFNPPTEHGVDLGMPVGTPIYAAYSGVVLPRAPSIPGQSIESNTGLNPWGWEADILTNIQGIGQVVNYTFHLDQLVITPGEHVSAGQLIGYSGGENSLDTTNVVPGYTPQTPISTAFSSGPHIEWGLYQQTGQSPIDPTPFLQAIRTSGIPGIGGTPAGNTLSATNPTGTGPLGIPSVGDVVSGIKSGFTDVFQRTGLVTFGALLVLVGVLVLFLRSDSAHALEQGAGQAMAQAPELAAA